MRILIVKLGAIGDVLRTTSILPGLRQQYPAAQIDWLTSTFGKELLVNNSIIEQIFTWEEKEALSSYDLVIGLEDEIEVCQLVSSVGQTVKGAYAESDKVVYSPSAWFDMSVISKFGLEKANQLKVQNRKTYQQHMADLLGIKVGQYVFSLTVEEIKYGQEIVRSFGFGAKEKIIGINTGAGGRWKYKA
ncbi:MAG: hypothetical protein ABIE84_04530, partial [bacterium]